MTLCERLGGIALCATLVSSTAFAGELVLNSDQSDPAPKKAMEELIASFEAANPDITIKWNNFDHEGYKSAIRNFLSAGRAGRRGLVCRQPHGPLCGSRTVRRHHRCLG